MARRERSFFFNNKTGALKSKGKTIIAATADNVLELRGGNSGQQVGLIAVGDDNNIDIAITPKGNGEVNIAAGNLNYAGTAITATGAELNFVDGVTSNIQTQLDAKTNNTGTVTSVAGTGTVNGLTLSGTVTSSGSLTLGGTLSITESQISDLGTYLTASDITGKLNLSGGTMSGAIAMGTNKITGMGDPTSAQDAATKAYVDSNVSSAANDATITITASTGLSGSASFTTDQSSDETITLAIDSTVATLTGAQTLTNKTLTSPTIETINSDLTVTGNLTVSGTTTTISTTNSTVADSLIELNTGASSNANDLGIVMERGSTGDNAIFIWDESADKFVVGTTTATGASTGNLSVTTGTLVANIEGNVTGNVTGDVTGNADTATALATARNIAGQSFDGSSAITIASTDLSDTSSITLNAATQTLTNKTLGATTIAGHIVPDTDDAYDLGSSSLKFKDLYLSGSSLFLEAFSLQTHASGITFNHSSNTTLLPVGGGSHTLATLTATQTLTNKTLTNPTINAFTGTGNGTVTGNLTVTSNVNADNFTTEGLKIVDNNIQSTRSNDHINLVPNGTGSVQINGSVWPTGLGTDGYVLTTDGAGTLTWAAASGGGQTAGHTIQNAGSNLTARAGLNFDGTYLIATDDSGNSQTDVTVSSALQTVAGITFPSGAVIGSSDTQTLTNKTIDSASNTLTLDLSEGTLTGTTAEFNTALSDDSFVTLTNTVTLTNKTLTSPTITGASLTSPTVTTAVTLNAQADLRFADSDSSHYVGFKAPATVTANNIWTLPAEDGSNTQVLTTDGSGTLSWTDGGGGGGASTLGGLNDVTVSSIAVNDLIVYTGSGFENKAKHEVVPTVNFTKRDGTAVLIELTNAYDTTTILGYMNDRVSQKYRMAFTDSSGTSHTTLQTGLDSVPELSNARNIGGVSFNGSVDIDLPGVNTAGNQDTSGTAAIGTSVTVTANNTANETVYLTFVDGATGTQGIETDTGLTYNPSTGNLGASIFTGTATSAQYADLAEMYATDEKISAGTVVMFAGAGKVKPCNDENCRRVAGIVSTDPAYLMNSACEGVPLAISGRVPCRVIGPVEAGDLMVSAGNGMAMTNNDAKSGTIIGKAIEENVNGEGIIEILAMMM